MKLETSRLGGAESDAGFAGQSNTCRRNENSKKNEAPSARRQNGHHQVR